MKKTLLEIVQDILSLGDDDDVNSISETVQAEQVAKLVASSYETIVAGKALPEMASLAQLEGLSDADRPNYLRLPDNVRFMEEFRYKIKGRFKTVLYEEPQAFISRISSRDTTKDNVILVEDVSSLVQLPIVNDSRPTVWTTFDDEHIVCDSYDSAVESTLHAANTMAYVLAHPAPFEIRDDFIPDLDATMFPALINEATSMYFAVFKSGVNQKVEQSARRARVATQNDMYRLHGKDRLVNYGRR